VAGEYDHLPEAAFYMVGGIEAIARAQLYLDQLTTLQKAILPA
jgi:F0F1-type ATP synthase beta subunit